MKVAATVPPRTRVSFCFHLGMRGRVGSWGVGRPGSLFCVWLCQAVSPSTHSHLHQASLNCPLCFQPLDLCNPARTLLLSEELLLYEGRNKAAEVRLTFVLPSRGFLVGFVVSPPSLFLMVLELYNLRVKKTWKVFHPPPYPPYHTVTQLFIVHL